MASRVCGWLRWGMGLAVALTVWWGWSLQSERAVLHPLTRRNTETHQRLTQLHTELTHVQQAARGTLHSLAGAAQALQRVVQQLRHQELAVTLTCQESTAMTLAALPLVALPCQITAPPTGLLSMVEVLHAIEQTQVVLPRVRLHVTEGTTIDVQVIGPEDQTTTQTRRRDAR